MYKYSTMKQMIKTAACSLAVLFAAICVKAQDFPTTEASVKEIFCKTWKVKELIRGEQKLEARAAGLEITITMKDDYTYQMNANNNVKKGKWELNLAKKQITLYENGSPTTLITSLTAEEFFAAPGKPIAGAKQKFGMIYTPSK